MRVLIVDEDAGVRRHLAQLLRALPGVTPVETASACAALAWSAAHEPDLVLVACAMPSMSGLQFLKGFRALSGRHGVPVIMTTAQHEHRMRDAALAMGVNDFLARPVDSTELRARVNSMLALRKSRLRLACKAHKSSREIVAREREAILRLSRAAEYRDPGTGAHLLRMARYAHLIAAKLGLPAAEQQLIMEAAPMHDIGKVGIPDHILLKPGELDDAELAVMRTHAEIGANILKDSVSPLLRAASAIALTHHEKYDGTGYPHGLKSDAIPLHGRIAAVADVFDAVTAPRPYKQAWSPERAAALIEDGAGSHFDPACVAAFLGDWDAVLRIHHCHTDDKAATCE